MNSENRSIENKIFDNQEISDQNLMRKFLILAL